MSDLMTEKIEEKKIKITYTNGHVKVVAILPHKDTGLYSYVNLTEGHICQCSFVSAEEALKDLDNYPNIEKWEFINEWHENSSDDLISRKEVLEILFRYGELNSDVWEPYADIKNLPTAYDVDAVCNKLDKASDYYETNEQGKEHVQMINLTDALEIVRNGGEEIMQEIKMYQCNFCGTKYNEKSRCQKCEKGHKKPIIVKNSGYIPISNDVTGYPCYVDIEMDNGKTVRYYKRKEVWE